MFGWLTKWLLRSPVEPSSASPLVLRRDEVSPDPLTPDDFAEIEVDPEALHEPLTGLAHRFRDALYVETGGAGGLGGADDFPEADDRQTAERDAQQEVGDELLAASPGGVTDPKANAPSAHAHPASVVTSASVLRLEQVLKALRTRGQRLTVEEIASIGLLLLDALDGAPDRHLGLPDPRNLLLVRAGTLRVLGAADADRRGSFAGRRSWLTPEGVAGHPLTARSDVFSVCAVLFAAATTLAPFSGDSDLAVLFAIREGRLAGPVESLRPDLPASFAQLVHRGLEVEPLRRLESLLALRRALVPFTGGVEAAREAFLQRAFTLAPPNAPSSPAALDDAAIVEAIAQGDEPARLVYADLLEERGLGHQARWLRSESRAQTMQAGAERDAALRELRDLRQLVGREFLATVGRPALEGCPVRFGFRCPMTWAALTPTSDPVVRYCAGCDSPVTFFDSLELARRASAEGKCVAIDPSVERHEGDLDPQHHAIVGMIG